MKKMTLLIFYLFATLGITMADDDKVIAISELPHKAQEFIKQHFSKSEIALVKMEKDFFEKNYEVIFINGDKIEFDNNGKWESVECKISAVPQSIIPKQIQEFVIKQYSKHKIIQIERSKYDYEIKLNNDLEIKFNRRFQVIDIDD